jgi:hypothetical protein
MRSVLRAELQKKAQTIWRFSQTLYEKSCSFPEDTFGMNNVIAYSCLFPATLVL